MIQMLCPKCGQVADAPESVVGCGEKCYRCQVPLEVAPSAVNQQRAALKRQHLQTLVLCAAFGAVIPVLFGLLGGQVGMSLASAVAGAFLGALVVVGHDLYGGLELALLFRDSSWISFWLWVAVGIGGIIGLMVGVTGQLEAEFGQAAVLGGAALGGLVLGALAGVCVHGTSAQEPTV